MGWLPSFLRRRNSRGSIRVVVIGNCQTRPIAELLTSLSDSIDVTATGLVHLIQDQEEGQFVVAFQQADYIFAQPVQDTHPRAFLHASELKRIYCSKVFFWTNLYFRGYNPELVYMRKSDNVPLRGPLGDYQNRTFFEGWKRGLSIEETIALHGDLDFNQEMYSGVPEESLAELKQREEMTHSKLTPVLEQHIWQQRLFFTFNHPKLYLLNILAATLLELADIPKRGANKVGVPEPLGLINPPINPWVVQTYGIETDRIDSWTGVQVESISANDVRVGAQRKYSMEEIVHLSFQIYDANRDFLLSRDWK